MLSQLPLPEGKRLRGGAQKRPMALCVFSPNMSENARSNSFHLHHASLGLHTMASLTSSNHPIKLATLIFVLDEET